MLSWSCIDDCHEEEEEEEETAGSSEPASMPPPPQSLKSANGSITPTPALLLTLRSQLCSSCISSIHTLAPGALHQRPQNCGREGWEG